MPTCKNCGHSLESHDEIFGCLFGWSDAEIENGTEGCKCWKNRRKQKS